MHISCPGVGGSDVARAGGSWWSQGLLAGPSHFATRNGGERFRAAPAIAGPGSAENQTSSQSSRAGRASVV